MRWNQEKKQLRFQFWWGGQFSSPKWTVPRLGPSAHCSYLPSSTLQEGRLHHRSTQLSSTWQEGSPCTQAQFSFRALCTACTEPSLAQEKCIFVHEIHTWLIWSQRPQPAQTRTGSLLPYTKTLEDTDWLGHWQVFGDCLHHSNGISIKHESK